MHPIAAVCCPLKFRRSGNFKSRAFSSGRWLRPVVCAASNGVAGGAFQAHNGHSIASTQAKHYQSRDLDASEWRTRQSASPRQNSNAREKKKTMVMLLEPDNSQGEIFIYREIVQRRNAKPLRLGVQAFSQEKISNRFENKTIIVQTA